MGNQLSWLEHRLCKPRVRGSSPLFSKILGAVQLVSKKRFFDSKSEGKKHEFLKGKTGKGRVKVRYETAYSE